MRLRQEAGCLADVQADFAAARIRALSAALDHDRTIMLTSMSASLDRSVGPMIAESDTYLASIRAGRFTTGEGA